MTRPTSLFLAVAALALTACAAEPTAPTRTLTAPTSASRDDVTTNPDGTCRSGYTVANGRCAPI
jgi:hypothetical protein